MLEIDWKKPMAKIGMPFGIAALLLIMGAGITAAPQQVGDGFRKLTGPEIQRVFEEIGSVDYPNDSGGGSGTWSISFDPNGTFDGNTAGANQSAFGVWYVEGDKQCVEIKGGQTDWTSPFEGCFTVYVNFAKGVIAVKIPQLNKDRIVLTDSAYGALASLAPQQRAPAASKPTPAADPSIAREREQLAADKRDLERQRIQFERDQLARQKAEFEQEKRKQASRLAAKAPVTPVAPVDQAPPTIDTAASISTNRESATISGTVKDGSAVARLEVNGREVSFRSIDGRFSVKTSVAIGRNSVRLAAIDIHGNRIERVVSVDRARRIPKVNFGKYYALVIGIEDYKKLPKLKTAVGDAKAVAVVLREKYGFTVSMLINPTRDDILDAFDDLAEMLGTTDNLLVYYAGHGWQDVKSGRGYWLPVNAKANRKSRWFSNADLTDSLKVIQAKHVMVVADSCYSGTLTRSIKVPDRSPEYISRMAAKRTRVVLSSGGLEPVADSGGGKYSVFANEFLKALNGNEGVLDGTQLFEQVRHKVVLNADQTPEYSDIRRAGHEGGDFLFVRVD